MGYIPDMGLDAFFGHIKVAQAEDVLAIRAVLSKRGIRLDTTRLCGLFFECKR
jgi:hypothetical protein